MSKTKRSLIHTYTNSNGNGHTNRLSDIINLKENKEEIDLSIKEVLKARTNNQKEYIKSIHENDVVFCTGCSGVGKTHIATGMAVIYLSKKLVDRIVITRPAVTCDEDLGYTPGDLSAKMDPYVKPIFDALGYFFTPDQINKLISGKFPLIEIVPLGMMRGRTFNKSFIFADEMQNATYNQIKLLLTRLGEGSTMVVNGDNTQNDLHVYGMTDLEKVINKLEGVDGIGFVRLTPADIQRHPRLGQILERL
jgi:phosphate starvation-inducible protein PhoH and related proteins